jgi:lantibiotic protection ABC transporter, ATP-binding subunit
MDVSGRSMIQLKIKELHLSNLYPIFRNTLYSIPAIRRKEFVVMDCILKTNALCKQFKGQMAVNKVSLNIPRNSVYGLLGPNGAGKSTTLKMLTGILKPTSGMVTLNGRPWNRKALNEIGALIEMPPLYENLTARENLKVRTTLLGLPDNRMDEVLEVVRLTDTGKKRAGQFSLGMKQRLGIASALLNHPKLLILDEPTNGLDPIGMEELRELIRSFSGKGMTVILSSHILSEVQQVADHIGIIAQGVLGYEGQLRNGQDLEQLFMQVIRQVGKDGE